MSKQLKADLMLLSVTLCWGFSYLFMDRCLDVMGVFMLNTYRFLGAFIVAFALSFKKLLHPNRTTLKYSALLGCALLAVYTTVSFGVTRTTLSNSGFLCALSVVFVPVINCIIKRTPPAKKLVFSVLICTAGIALLTLTDDFSFNREHLAGDILCALCSVAYAVQLILTESALSHKEVDAYQLGVYQLGFMGVFCLILTFVLETPVLPATAAVWGEVITLAVVCTGAAFVIQVLAQQYTTASHVGVIFCMEPVFAGLVAYFFAGEVLSWKAYIGAALIIIGIMLMEMKQKSKSAEQIDAPDDTPHEGG